MSVILLTTTVILLIIAVIQLFQDQLNSFEFVKSEKACYSSTEPGTLSLADKGSTIAIGFQNLCRVFIILRPYGEKSLR